MSIARPGPRVSSPNYIRFLVLHTFAWLVFRFLNRDTCIAGRSDLDDDDYDDDDEDDDDGDGDGNCDRDGR